MPSMTQPRAQRQKHSADGGRATVIRDTKEAVHIDPHAFGLAKAAYSVGETLDLLSIGRTSLYASVKRGELKRVEFGKKTLFCAADIAAFLVRLQTGTCKV